jgi:phosphoribosylanthranilate isomerase
MSRKTLRLKVCGMRDASNIAAVAALKPDYLGFIFYRNSKRFVGEDFEIPRDLSPGIKRVGVFVNDSTETILAVARVHSLNLIQLHGRESVSQCEELRAEGFQVIKAFGLKPETDMENLTPFKNKVDFFLFDTAGNDFGGTGKVFDWNVLARYDQDVPFFLSGGLSLQNVENVKALRQMNLYGLDVNSGVEISPGLKDVEKLQSFIDLIPK